MVTQKHNFISESENNFLVDLLNSKIKNDVFPSEPFYIWKEIKKTDECFNDLTFLKVYNRNLFFANSLQKKPLRLDYLGFAVQTKGFDYHADAVWPENESDRNLGIPSLETNSYKNYSGKWIPNYVPNRKYTTVLYLNDDIVGGQTHFPMMDIKIQPEKNKIVGFGCDEQFVHGVIPTVQGIRKVFICWFE